MKLIKALVIGVLFLQPAHAFQADTQNISPDQYFKITLTEFSQAKESIYAVMYLASLDPTEPNSQVSQLLKGLVDAKNRGVQVKVILDQNLDFTDESRQDQIYQNKNQAAFEYLRANSIEVFYDTAETYTHAKAIVIDGETSIFGSTNWSKAALTKNNEVNALIRSKEYAENLINQFDQIKLQEYIPAVVTPSVKIPRDFLKEKMLGEMVSQSDERTFDVYLYLLGQYNQNKDSKVELNYGNLAVSLDIEKMGKENYRRQITKILSKLKEKYGLIDYKKVARNQSANITLKKLQGDSFELPTAYWKSHWNQRLSLSAKAMYLIILSCTNPSNPSFAMSREDLSKTYHISESFISDGTKELRIQNLLDIQYSSLEDQDYSRRQPNVYTPKPIYDSADFQKALKSIEQKEGSKKLERAIATAGIIYEQNDLKTIQALIVLESQYGQEIIHEAAVKLADKNPDNPKRAVGYLISTIKSIAAQRKASI